jgi:hypothetical protein
VIGRIHWPESLLLIGLPRTGWRVIDDLWNLK